MEELVKKTEKNVKTAQMLKEGFIKVRWKDLKNGDVVYLAGTHLGEFKAYGPHTVSRTYAKELVNSKGRKFLQYEEILICKLPEAKDFLLKNAIEIASHEVEQWWQNAAGDMGYYYDENYMDDDSAANKAFKSFLKHCDNKEIAKEAMADWFYDDVSSIVDCCGDRIYDEVTMIRTNPAGFAKDKTHSEVFIAVCEYCRDHGNGTNWKSAMSRMIMEEKLHVEKMAKRKA